MKTKSPRYRKTREQKTWTPEEDRLLFARLVPPVTQAEYLQACVDVCEGLGRTPAMVHGSPHPKRSDVVNQCESLVSRRIWGLLTQYRRAEFPKSPFEKGGREDEKLSFLEEKLLRMQSGCPIDLGPLAVFLGRTSARDYERFLEGGQPKLC